MYIRGFVWDSHTRKACRSCVTLVMIATLDPLNSREMEEKEGEIVDPSRRFESKKKYQ